MAQEFLCKTNTYVPIIFPVTSSETSSSSAAPWLQESSSQEQTRHNSSRIPKDTARGDSSNTSFFCQVREERNNLSHVTLQQGHNKTGHVAPSKPTCRHEVSTSCENGVKPSEPKHSSLGASCTMVATRTKWTATSAEARRWREEKVETTEQQNAEERGVDPCERTGRKRFVTRPVPESAGKT